MQTLLHQAITALTAVGCDTPRLDAELIFAHALGQNRSWLYAHSQDLISESDQAQIQHLVARRLKREPLAYLLQQRAFYGLSFTVTPDVLIPRPETEMLVELALQYSPHSRDGPHLRCRLIDVGTGSGCIAVAIATHLPQAQIVATDLSSRALAVARQNIERYSLADRIALVQADLLSGLHLTPPNQADIIVSNPPYVAPQALETLAPEVQAHEPRLALTDAADGLSIITRLLQQARHRLKPNGLLLLEIGADQGPAVLQRAHTHCPQADFQIKPDLSGRDRILWGRFR